MRLDRIVIGIDFSEPALGAARWTARHLAPEAELVLVHVVAAPRPPVYFEGLLPPRQEVLGTAREDVVERLSALAASLPSERVQVESHTGQAAELLGRRAAELDADLVVVGEHGHRRGIWHGLGSTAEQLLHCAPVPVLLARGFSDESPRRILTPVDDSDLTAPVLEWAALLQKRARSEVIAVHVLSLLLHGHMRAVLSQAKTRSVEESARAGAGRWLTDRLADTGVDRENATVEVSTGHPAYEILAAARRHEVDLIVMGSRGAGAVGRTLIGSVAGSVLKGASCSVLVVVDR